MSWNKWKTDRPGSCKGNQILLDTTNFSLPNPSTSCLFHPQLRQWVQVKGNWLQANRWKVCRHRELPDLIVDGLLQSCIISPLHVTPEPRAAQCHRRLMLGPKPGGSSQDHSTTKEHFPSFQCRAIIGQVLMRVLTHDSVGLAWDLQGVPQNV